MQIVSPLSSHSHASNIQTPLHEVSTPSMNLVSLDSSKTSGSSSPSQHCFAASRRRPAQFPRSVCQGQHLRDPRSSGSTHRTRDGIQACPLRMGIFGQALMLLACHLLGFAWQEQVGIACNANHTKGARDLEPRLPSK